MPTIYDEDRQTSPSNAAEDEERRLANIASGRSKHTADTDKNELSASKTDGSGEENERQDLFNSAVDQNDNLFSNTEGQSRFGRLKSRFKAMSTAKKAGIGIGLSGFIIGLIFGGIGFFGFLNTFRLDHLMSNIEKKAFLRYQVDMDDRSSKWINTYLMLRLGEVDDPELAPEDRDNIVFRSNRVDNNNPLTDWYKTMRASKFEADLFEKQGIRFASFAYRENGVIKFRPAIITVNGDTTKLNLTDAELRALGGNGNLDVNALNGRLRQFVDINALDGDRAGRKAIKEAVNSNTRWYQVMKRFYLRKSIQNMTGVRSWRFFEKTRDNASEKAKSVRNKIIAASLPENTKSGKIIQCIFGITECKGGTDPNNPENRAGSSASGISCAEDPNHESCTIQEDTNSSDDTDDSIRNHGEAESGLKDGVSSGLMGDLVKQIVKKLNLATGIVSLVDTLSRVDENVKNGSLSSMVYMARATQAIGLYTTYTIARDQMKSGELAPEETNEFMKTVDGAGSSEGWNKVIDNDADTLGKVSAATVGEPKAKSEYCSQEHQDAMLLPKNAGKVDTEYHYLCDSEKIGSKNLAATIENGWNQSIGLLFGPVFEAYRNSLGVAVQFIEGLLDKILGPVIEGLLKGLGLQGTVEDLAAWAVGKASQVLGAGPTVFENSPSGVIANHNLMGGSASAEFAMRYQGAGLSNEATTARATEAVAAYNQYEDASMDFATRYLSLANPTSLFSSTLFAFSNTKPESVFASVIGSIKNLPGSLFSTPADAAKTTGYEAANWAGVRTYDFPEECINGDPMSMTPAKSTNADELGLISAGELSWELLESSDAFYGKLYDLHPDAGETIEKVYNCLTLDSTIRGSIGAPYGVDLGPNALNPQDDGTTDAASGGSKFRIASFNIKGSIGDGKTNWEDRLENTTRVINGNKLNDGDNIEVVGLQELKQDQMNRLMDQSHLGPTYNIYPESFNGPSESGMSENAIIWDESRFDFVSGRGIAIPEMQGFDGLKKRELPLIKLRDKETQQEFYVMNTHDPAYAYNAGLRLSNARFYAKFFSDLSQEGVPMFLTGDFNSGYWVRTSGNTTAGGKRENLTYCVITAAGTLWNAYDASQTKDGACPTTSGVPNSVDHIYLSTDIEVSNFFRSPMGPKNNGSDVHDTIIADISIPSADLGSNAGSEFKIASYNLPIRSGDSGRNKATTNIRSKGFDVIGFQEISNKEHYQGLKRLLAQGGSAESYAMYPNLAPGTEVVEHSSASQSIAYRTDKFEFIKGELFDYPRYHNERSFTIAGEYIDKNRANAPIIWLKDRQTGQVVIFINIHNAAYARNAEIRYRANKVFIATIQRIKDENPGTPIFLTGDFNEGYGVRKPGEAPNVTYQQDYHNLLYCMFAENGLMKDVAAAADGRKTSCPNSRYGGVDYIYGFPDIEAINYGEIASPASGSDHKVVYATVRVPSTGGKGKDSSDAPNSKGWVWPVEKKYYPGTLSNCFRKPGHTGIDIGVPVGTPVVAAKAGKVVMLDKTGSGDGGKYIVIQHGLNEFSNYQHNSEVLVNDEQQVRVGQQIAKSGNTGYSFGPHVHFSITTQLGLDSRSKVAYSVNPLGFLPSDRGTGACR